MVYLNVQHYAGATMCPCQAKTSELLRNSRAAPQYVTLALTLLFHHSTKYENPQEEFY